MNQKPYHSYSSQYATYVPSRARALRLVCLAFLLLLSLWANVVHATCSTWRTPAKVWFNEYFFGVGKDVPPNFLEVFSSNNAFPASWQNWSIDVYTSPNTKETYPLTNSTATACTVGNKTWLTTNVPGSLQHQEALVLLRDNLGHYVDALVFDNTAPPAPWPGAPANSWFPDLNNSSIGCPALATALTTQASNSGTIAKQSNMLVLNNFGNKDLARDPDGGDIWDDTSNTGAGTTYTQCVSNNLNFTKTVDNAVPAPGSTVTYTLRLANTGSTAMTGVKIVDYLPPPPALTYVSATPSNALDPAVTTAPYPTTDPNTGAAATSTMLTWSPAAVPAGGVSTLNIKMQVAANAVEGYSYVNTAQTISGVATNQTDYANVTIGSPNTPSFAITVSPASSTTCTPATLGPKVTITAMSAANGGGTKIADYNGTVTLTASKPTPRWYNSAGVALSGNTVQLQNGEATLYLTDTVAETFTVSAVDAVYASPNVMYGTSGNITFSDTSTGIALIDADMLSPAYGVVAGRPHKVQVKVTACGSAASTAGSYSGTVYYVPGLNHPPTSSAPTINPTTASCPGTVQVPTSTAGASINLNFSAGVAHFYLCTTDVGQYGLGLRMTNIPSGGSTTAVSSNFTVRPYAVTAANFKNGGTLNPKGAGAFASAGKFFSGELKAWRWVASTDTETDALGNVRGNGLPDTLATAAMIINATPGLTQHFSGSVNNAGKVSLAARLEAPVGGKLGDLTPSSATLTAGETTLVDTISYSEVGNFKLGGTDTTGTYAVTNYLGVSGLNVPILSDVVGRIIPDHFVLEAAGLTRRPTCPVPVPPDAGSVFTYMDEPFNVGFTLTARNAGDVKTENYQGAFAFLDPVTANWNATALGNIGSIALGAFNGGTDYSSRLGTKTIAPATWVRGSAQVSASVRFSRSAAPDGPMESLAIGVAPQDLDGVKLKQAALTVGGSRAPIDTTRMRFGRLKPFDAFVSGQASLKMPVQVQYWGGKSWVLNGDDNCTTVPSSAMRGSNYLNGTGSATANWPVTIAPAVVKITAGHGTVELGKPAAIRSGSVDICFDLDADRADGPGTKCEAVPAGLPYLQGRWLPGTFYDNDPSARATFGIYSPETRRMVYVRELF